MDNMTLHTGMEATSRRSSAGWRFAAALAGLLVTAGCATTDSQPPEPTAQAGSQIWTATCNRCHNARPGAQFTAEEWPVLVQHMRTRAHLTRAETEAVTAFLQELAAGR